MSPERSWCKTVGKNPGGALEVVVESSLSASPG